MNTTLNTEERNRLFNTFATPHLDYIALLVRSRTLPSEDPDDNLQEVLLHLLLNIHLFRPDTATFRQWATTVVGNKMKMIHRHETSLHRFFAKPQSAPPQSSPQGSEPDGDADELESPEPIGSPEPIDFQDSQDFSPSVASALQRLPPSQRRVLLLTADGWSVADIAADSGLTASAVSGLLFRARSTMKKLLSQS